MNLLSPIPAVNNESELALTSQGEKNECTIFLLVPWWMCVVYFCTDRAIIDISAPDWICWSRFCGYLSTTNTNRVQRVHAKKNLRSNFWFDCMIKFYPLWLATLLRHHWYLPPCGIRRLHCCRPIAYTQNEQGSLHMARKNYLLLCTVILWCMFSFFLQT